MCFTIHQKHEFFTLSWLDKHKLRKNVATSKRYILRKRAQKLKSNLKKPIELQSCFSAFWKIQFQCMYVSIPYFSWHKVLIWSIKNRWFLNFNYVFLIIKLAGGVWKSYHHDTGAYLYPGNSHIMGKSLSQHPETRLIILLY